jgi:hypothetical protein
MNRHILFQGRSLARRLGPVFVAALWMGAAFGADPRLDKAGNPADGSAQAVAEFRKGMDSVMRGDMKTALPLFRALSPAALPERERKALLSLLKRFDGKAPLVDAQAEGLDAWTAQLLGAYRAYWSRVMLRTVSAEAGEKELSGALRRLLPEDDPVGAHPEMDALEVRLDEKLQALGYHALFGMTLPYREFMLWRVHTNRSYPIDLPGGREEVPVAMLDGFVSLGWMGFASGDRYHSGGWATPDRLYCVRSSYDLDSEDFRISYIAHEGQHFSDYRRFPGLAQPELEYRAKLVEVSLADTTLKHLLADFGSNGSDLRDQPHPHAQRRVMKDLAQALLPGASPQGKWWEPFSPASIRAAAKSLLEEDTRRLQALSRAGDKSASVRPLP